ncbi:MAG: hypothetical protein MUF42_17775, partial [Cytophagaceae bacterium]|nr:hypothetical protein [Cytophagaceae bacterium]
VDEKARAYLKTYKDQLGEIFLEKFFLYKEAKEYKHYRFLDWSDMVWGRNGPSKLPYSERKEQLDTLEQMYKESAERYDVAKIEFHAMVKAYMLNEDLAHIDKGILGGFVSSFGEGLGEALVGGNIESNQDLISSFVSSMQSAGMKVSEEQLLAAEPTFVQKLGATIGGAIPTMVEIAIMTALTEGAYAAVAVTRAATTIQAFLRLRLGAQAGARVFSIVRSTLIGNISFALSGESAAGGAAEGATQGLLDIYVLSKLGNKYNKLLMFAIKSLAAPSSRWQVTPPK